MTLLNNKSIYILTKGVCFKNETDMWEEKLKIYDELIAKCPKFDRLGKTMPYTATNGYMFSLFNKACEIRYSFF